MRVKATLLGYYGMQRMKPGSIFELVEIKGMKLDPATKKLVPGTFSPEDQFSSVWMEKVVDAEPAKKPEPEVAEKKSFGAKKPKSVGYSASLDSGASSLSTGNLKVI